MVSERSQQNLQNQLDKNGYRSKPVTEDTNIES